MYSDCSASLNGNNSSSRSTPVRDMSTLNGIFNQLIDHPTVGNNRIRARDMGRRVVSDAFHNNRTNVFEYLCSYNNWRVLALLVGLRTNAPFDAKRHEMVRVLAARNEIGRTPVFYAVKFRAYACLFWVAMNVPEIIDINSVDYRGKTLSSICDPLCMYIITMSSEFIYVVTGLYQPRVSIRTQTDPDPLSNDRII